jgi:hypothetical protein
MRWPMPTVQNKTAERQETGRTGTNEYKTTPEIQAMTDLSRRFFRICNVESRPRGGLQRRCDYISWTVDERDNSQSGQVD